MGTLNFFASGFCANAALYSLFEGDVVWCVVMVSFAIMNYFVGKSLN
jgi:hypothetical protein